MRQTDLNLLIALDVLLTEGNVARAARRLGLSASAMSRALTRLRVATGDPLLVRAGRGLVPTPRALTLREPVHQMVADAERLLRPAGIPNLKHTARMFTLRASEGFPENFGVRLMERLHTEAPAVQLRFVQKVDKQSASLRDGSVDLETGVLSKEMGLEICGEPLFTDRFVGVVRQGHPLLDDDVTPFRYGLGRHVVVSRTAEVHGPIDAAMESAGFAREVGIVVGGFATALAIAASSDLIASVPERHTGVLRASMCTFELPVDVPPFTVSMFWHPRMDADPLHHWLRGCVREVTGTSEAIEGNDGRSGRRRRA